MRSPPPHPQQRVLSPDGLAARRSVKYGQPAAYSVALLAWSGLEYRDGFRAAGSLAELKAAVKWGTDFILASATQLERNCTFYAQACL